MGENKHIRPFMSRYLIPLLLLSLGGLGCQPSLREECVRKFVLYTAKDQGDTWCLTNGFHVSEQEEGKIRIYHFDCGVEEVKGRIINSQGSGSRWSVALTYERQGRHWLLTKVDGEPNRVEQWFLGYVNREVDWDNFCSYKPI